MSKLRAQVEEILRNYEEIARRDPNQLRLKIPAKEVWRFFIDGCLQEKGRNLSNHKIFQSPPIHKRFFCHNPLYYTIDQYTEIIETENMRSPEDLYSSGLLQLLARSKWRLSEQEKGQFKLIDIINMDKAWIPFERNEPGYLRGLMKAFSHIFQFDTPLTLNFIKDLHAIAVEGVLGTAYKDENGKNDFRTSSLGCYQLDGRNVSAAGLYEFINNIMKDTDNEHELHICRTTGGGDGFILNAQSIALIEHEFLKQTTSTDEELENIFINFTEVKNEKRKKAEFFYTCEFIKKLISTKNQSQFAKFLWEEIKESELGPWYNQGSKQHVDINQVINKKLQQLINVYETKIKTTNDPIIKLMIIINFIQSCEQLHPFIDGNCRTFCMLLLNHLLMKNGFPPAILEDPNKFDLFGKNELLHEVLNGMQNTLVLINTGSLYNVNTDKILSYLETESYLTPFHSYFNEVVQNEELSRQTSPKFLKVY